MNIKNDFSGNVMVVLAAGGLALIIAGLTPLGRSYIFNFIISAEAVIVAFIAFNRVLRKKGQHQEFNYLNIVVWVTLAIMYFLRAMSQLHV